MNILFNSSGIPLLMQSTYIFGETTGTPQNEMKERTRILAPYDLSNVSYIDAAVKNKKLEPNMILDEFMDYYQSYLWRDEIGGDHSTAQRYMRQDLKRLVEARMGEKDKQGNITVVWEEGNEVHDFWKDKLN